MINSYKNGKDLYSMIASKVYHNNYEDNLEHNPDGSINEGGKKRRSSVKSLLLGITYGMGIQSIAELIKGTKEDAKNLLDSFYEQFPNVKKWTDETESNAHKTGYVEDWFGRKRRLPDLLLPKYEASYKDDSKAFNPFLECDDARPLDDILRKWLDKANKSRGYNDFEEIQRDALAKGIILKSNSSFISQAERQCVNARVQGGAATMTKLALVRLYNDKEMNDLGFRMLITVHDEIIGECPKQNAEKVAERMSYIMTHCVENVIKTPFKCDAEISERWYEPEYLSMVGDEYKSLLQSGISKEEARARIYEEFYESDKDFLDKALD